MNTDLDPDQKRMIRHRLNRFQAPSPAAELSRLRVRLDALEEQINAQMGGRSQKLHELHGNCLKAIAALALREIRTR
jgi:hypothetical protein